MKKIAIAGTGYVGLSNAILLVQNNEVVALDIIPEKVDMINKKISPVEDKDIEEYLQRDDLNFRATLDKKNACTGAEYVILAQPRPTISDLLVEGAIKGDIDVLLLTLLKHRKNLIFSSLNIIPSFKFIW